MKRKLTTLLLILVFLIGLSLMLYPTFSNWWNSYHQSKVTMAYTAAVEEMSDETFQDMLAAARAYNAGLRANPNRYILSDKELEEYNALLNLTGNGMMGRIEIPKINVDLPIYHTTDTDVLQHAIGHLPGTSLPTGGEGTHCVVSGHRGLPSARLFTDLDKLQEGDVFYVHVLRQTLCYEVDRILTVEPTDVEALEISESRDEFTLVTCTPYAINTHRLLVRGHRVSISDEDEEYHFSAEALRIEPGIVAPFVAVPMLLILLGLLLLEGHRKKRQRKQTTKRM